MENLVLLNGLLTDQRLWHNQIKVLEPHTKILVPNLTTQTSIRDLAKYVLNLAPEKFALAGFSMGGYVALEIMKMAPERITKLALINTQCREDDEERKTYRQSLIDLTEKGKFKGVTPRLLPRLMHPKQTRNQHLIDLIMDMATTIGKDGFINQQHAIIGRKDKSTILKKIKIPTLLIGGTDDQLTPPDRLKEMAEKIKNSRLEILDECGHLSPLEKPNQVNQLMKAWLGL